MVTNVTSLLKTVKAVEDEATKGTRGLEATIEHIKQELAVSATVTAAQVSSCIVLYIAKRANIFSPTLLPKYLISYCTLL